MIRRLDIRAIATALAPEIARLLKAADDAKMDGAFIASQPVEWQKARSKREGEGIGPHL